MHALFLRFLSTFVSPFSSALKPPTLLKVLPLSARKKPQPIAGRQLH